MFREHCSKHAHERQQQELQAQQQAPAHAPSPSASPSELDSSSRCNSSHSSSSHNSSYHHSSSSHGATGSHVEYISEDSDVVSAQFIPWAQDYPPPHFSITGHGMFERFDHLRQRKFENTHFHFGTLQSFGVYVDFTRLTQRIGLTAAFFGIHCDCYDELTLEFLSSLKLRYDVENQAYIKFQMRNQTWRVGVTQLREWFRLPANPQTDSLDFRVGYDKDHFWRLITGMETTTSNQF